MHLSPDNCFSNTNFPDVIQSQTGSRWKLTHRYKEGNAGTEHIPDNGSLKLVGALERQEAGTLVVPV